jgi:hypothetical protein
VVVALAACGRLDFHESAVTTSYLDSPAKITYRDVVMADQPMAYWRLADTGPVAHDETGHFDGTYSGTCVQGVAGALAGDPDPAVRFDGTACQITLPDAFGFPSSAAFSIEAWISTISNNGYRHIFTKETRTLSGPIDGYAVLLAPAGLELERVVANGQNTTPASLFPQSSFVHIVAVFTGLDVQLYIGGVLASYAPDTRSMNTISTRALIGASTTGNFYQGTLDEVAVYDHALDLSRIQAHLAAGS